MTMSLQKQRSKLLYNHDKFNTAIEVIIRILDRLEAAEIA